MYWKKWLGSFLASGMGLAIIWSIAMPVTILQKILLVVGYILTAVSAMVFQESISQGSLLESSDLPKKRYKVVEIVSNTMIAISPAHTDDVRYLKVENGMLYSGHSEFEVTTYEPDRLGHLNEMLYFKEGECVFAWA